MTLRVVTSAGEAAAKADRVIVSWHEVAFEGVTRFAFADVDTNPWTTTALTDISKRDREGRTEYAFTLSGNEDALLITCEDVRVTFLQRDEVHESAVR